MNYSAIKYCDIANGEGVRTSLFVSGCRRHCRNCFNQETWSFSFGDNFTKSIEEEILASLEPYYVAGLSILGGEPLEPENVNGVYKLCMEAKRHCPTKNIWVYSGFTLEELMERFEQEPELKWLLSTIDVLVDGPYVENLHDITLRFRGSSNQRILDMPKTIATGTPVLWNDDPQFSTHAML